MKVKPELRGFAPIGMMVIVQLFLDRINPPEADRQDQLDLKILF